MGVVVWCAARHGVALYPGLYPAPVLTYAHSPPVHALPHPQPTSSPTYGLFIPPTDHTHITKPVYLLAMNSKTVSSETKSVPLASVFVLRFQR